MKLERIDHFVLTVSDIDQTCEFYSTVLGMQAVTFGNVRKALQFGQQKINLHKVNYEYEPKALHPTTGSGDICFITNVPLLEVIDHLASCGIKILEGIVQRTGAVDSLDSIYIRDPDGNLIEISNYVSREQHNINL